MKRKPSNILRSKKVYGLKILQSIIYVKENFYNFFSTLRDTVQAQSKINHWIRKNLIFSLKRISEKCFLFNFNVNTSLKLLWAIRGLSESNQVLGHSEGTWAPRGHLDTRRAPGHSEGTQRALKALRYLST